MIRTVLTREATVSGYVINNTAEIARILQQRSELRQIPTSYQKDYTNQCSVTVDCPRTCASSILHKLVEHVGKLL